MDSLMREQHYRLVALERTAQEAATHTAVMVPSDVSPSATRVLNNISTNTGKTALLYSADISTNEGGFLEVYARVTADALVSGGTGRSMTMRIDVDGVSQGSYLSWTDQALTEKKTIQGSTVGTSATPAGGFVVVDDALPNTGYDDATNTEANSIYNGLVLNAGVHTVDFNMVCTGSGTFGSVITAVISIRTT
jgi:hypothetical protein